MNEDTTIQYSQFADVVMQVGTIISVEDFPRARNPSYRLKIDFGDGNIKQSSAQITRYTHAQLLGQQVICVTNMPPRNIAGFMSEVLVLGASNDAGEIVLLQPESIVPLGKRIH